MRTKISCAWLILAIIALLEGCSTIRAEPPATIEKTVFSSAAVSSPDTKPKPTPGSTVVEHAAQVFAHALSASATDAGDEPKALNAFRSGRALIDLHCSDYLVALGNANQRAGNQRQQLGIVGGALAAIGGLTGAEAKEIAVSSTLFSFGGASLDASTVAFIFSDAAKSLTKLVREAQKVYMESVQAQSEPLDYAGAVNLLTGYEGLCKPGEIRRLIDEAITSAKIVADTPGALPAATAALILVNNLIGEFRRPLTEADAITLYAWYTLPDRRPDIAKNEIVKDLLQGTSNEKLADRLAKYFVPLLIKGDPVGGRWAAAVPRVPGASAAPPDARLLRRSLGVTIPSISVAR